MIKLVLVLVALSPVVFLIGLVKPKWILFWVKQPDRLIASSVGILMFMSMFTLYSELRVQHRAKVDTTQGDARSRPQDQTNDLQLDHAR
jgi:ABC-type nickel/cobalt efflux system permease component RcnA